MGMFKKIDEQIDKNYEVVSNKKVITRTYYLKIINYHYQNFYLKILVLLLFVFNIIVIITKLFL